MDTANWRTRSPQLALTRWLWQYPLPHILPSIIICLRPTQLSLSSPFRARAEEVETSSYHYCHHQLNHRQPIGRVSAPASFTTLLSGTSSALSGSIRHSDTAQVSFYPYITPKWREEYVKYGPKTWRWRWSCCERPSRSILMLQWYVRLIRRIKTLRSQT